MELKVFFKEFVKQAMASPDGKKDAAKVLEALIELHGVEKLARTLHSGISYAKARQDAEKYGGLLGISAAEFMRHRKK